AKSLNWYSFSSWWLSTTCQSLPSLCLNSSSCFPRNRGVSAEQGTHFFFTSSLVAIRPPCCSEWYRQSQPSAPRVHRERTKGNVLRTLVVIHQVEHEHRSRGENGCFSTNQPETGVVIQRDGRLV